MRVTMIGTGYVGLVSGACFADFGHVVTCVDKDPGKIDRLKEGVMPIFEPGLAELVANNVNEGRLFFTPMLPTRSRTPTRSSSPWAPPPAAATAMPTSPTSMPPPKEIAEHMDGFTVVVTKSTVPVGTGR
jgi:UDPglucose 6-dehydrogenase